jgi:hypothetical protein
MNRNRVIFALAACMMAACSAASAAEKAWIVVDLQMPDGTSAQMAFDNPAVPDMTLKDCEGALESATPTLMEHISKQPATKGAKMLSAKCVWSATDPIKPAD